MFWEQDDLVSEAKHCSSCNAWIFIKEAFIAHAQFMGIYHVDFQNTFMATLQFKWRRWTLDKIYVSLIQIAPQGPNLTKLSCTDIVLPVWQVPHPAVEWRSSRTSREGHTCCFLSAASFCRDVACGSENQSTLDNGLILHYDRQPETLL